MAEKSEKISEDKPAVVAQKDEFPLCIVWCPIPGLTWMFPPIGHLGIATSDGTIHDFAGSYFVNRNAHRMGFGTVTKYAPIDLKDIKLQRRTSDPELIKVWDDNISQASEEYDQMEHNLLTNNCHAHVARVLNRLQYKNFTYWNTLTLILFMIFQGRFVSVPRFLKTYVPFFVLLLIVVAIVVVSKMS